jgi:hypothetical protein
MKMFRFFWKVDGRFNQIRERHRSYRSAERRAKELARELGVEVRAGWQLWECKAQP